MKAFSGLLALTLCAGLATSGYAQSGMGVANSKDITVGPMFTAGASGSAGTVKQGTKTDYRFAFSGGALGFLPISNDISFGLGLVYDSRGVNYHDQANTSNGINTTLSYFSIRPVFRFSDFYIGAGIGVPLSVSNDILGVPPPSIQPFVKDSLNTLFEVRIGGAISLTSSDMGDLRLLLDAAYPFTKIAGSATENNGPLPTAQIGLCYLFDTHSAQ